MDTKIHTQYPSRYKIGEEVGINFNMSGKIKKGCFVRAVHFTDSKVRYDVDIPFIEENSPIKEHAVDKSIKTTVSFTLLEQVDSICVVDADFKLEEVRILNEPSNWPLSWIFKELKFGRPIANQEYLDKCIAELETPEGTTNNQQTVNDKNKQHCAFGCVDEENDLWENIACKLKIEPNTCGREDDCTKCPNLIKENLL
jgi:hypothetical protein